MVKNDCVDFLIVRKVTPSLRFLVPARQKFSGLTCVRVYQLNEVVLDLRRCFWMFFPGGVLGRCQLGATPKPEELGARDLQDRLSLVNS